MWQSYTERTRSGPEVQALIPLFYGEKQQKTSVQALRRPESKLQVIDFLWSLREFRCADEQRNFSAYQRN
jgi:hypothetical protein